MASPSIKSGEMAGDPNISIIQEKVSHFFDPLGLEAHPFKVSWYNSEVKKQFRLNYADDTLAFCLVSAPSMFEKGFVPYLKQIDTDCTRDPLDQCMALHLQKVKLEFPEYNIDIIHDYEVLPNRRPRILVQTAGHVSGAAYYYQMKDISSSSWTPSQKMYGVSIHPKYSGWFSFRGVLIFENVQIPNLIEKEPVDIVKDDEKKIKLLEQFNFCWQDWKYRDIVPSIAQYSENQRKYFVTPPAERGEVLKGFDLS